jgi:hypothetical protein
MTKLKNNNLSFGYIIMSETFYFESVKVYVNKKESINIGYYSFTEGGTTGEFSLNWIEEYSILKMYSKIYSDGYNAFNEFLIAFNSYSDEQNPSPTIVLESLKKYGAIDFTKRKP